MWKWGGFFQNKDGVVAYKRDKIVLELEEHLDEAFGVHIPIPFCLGNLVKSIDFRNPPIYGMVHERQGKTKEEWQDGVMGVRLDISWGDEFGWKKGVQILSLSHCREKELPHDNRMLKLVSRLRKGVLVAVTMFLCEQRRAG